MQPESVNRLFRQLRCRITSPWFSTKIGKCLRKRVREIEKRADTSVQNYPHSYTKNTLWI